MDAQIIHVVGARPNLMKAAPVFAALSRRQGIRQLLVHTGQHYDSNMSDVFFRQLGLPQPDLNLEVGSGSHAVQTARIMMSFEKVVLDNRPDLVLVYGDVNSTVACALVCAKLQIPVGHVEAGLRSFDHSMPEEINRVLTDQIANLLFTPSADGDENLRREGIATKSIYRVGNVMIDTLVRLSATAQELWRDRWSREIPDRYTLVTLHRPSNVDASRTLLTIVGALDEISCHLPVFFPIHPRTRQRLNGSYSNGQTSPALALNLNLHLLEPLGYLDFLALQQHATLVITDSGGIQEETTFLGIPCLTMRDNTERPITVTMGTNTLIGQDINRLKSEVTNVLAGKGKQGRVPPLWDGRSALRIADVIDGWRK
jgi:UDP-N-acetylglucosamine 2-epimerase (non-hydrolysing)